MYGSAPGLIGCNPANAEIVLSQQHILYVGSKPVNCCLCAVDRNTTHFQKENSTASLKVASRWLAV